MSGGTVDDELIQLGHQLQEAVVRQDGTALDALVHDDFELITPSAMNGADKQQWIALATGAFTMRAFQRSDTTVRRYGDVALVNSSIRQEAAYQGEDASREFLTTDIWVKTPNSWQLALRHATPR